MKIRVISLPEREDRREQFRKNNSAFLEGYDWEFVQAVDGKKLNHEKLLKAGFDTNKNWRDPLLKRTLTKGEIGCFLSQYKLWEECTDSGEPLMIVEDDVVFTESPAPAIEEFWGHDVLYLTYREMDINGAKRLTNSILKPCYPYLCSAYILTPEAAEILVSTDIHQNIIPCDEYFPQMTDKLNFAALIQPVCYQVSRDELGTNIEPKNESDYFVDFTTHVLTVGDDDEKMERLHRSAEIQGFKVTNVLSGEWQGGTMEGPGGGQKVLELRSALDKLPNHDVVLFTDAFDVFFCRPLSTIVGRFLGFHSEVVFSAEQHLWPDTSLRFPPTSTKFRYLNSGTFIGRVKELKAFLSGDLQAHEDDQLFLQKKYLTRLYDVKLDFEQYIFMTHDEEVKVVKEQIQSPNGGCFGCVYHGNGGQTAKNKLESLYASLYPELKFAPLEVMDYKVIGNEMLLVDFMTEEQCEEWIEIGERHGGWAPHHADKFPSHDIHLKELGLWDVMDAWWNRVAAKVFESYWRPTFNHHLRKAFLMRYSADTQKTLGLHNDASMVTGSVKLNDNYEGATLIFPRQNVTNKDIPIGKMILFPGQVTHGHYVDELVEGTKYSLTLWSARYNGDYLDP